MYIIIIIRYITSWCYCYYYYEYHYYYDAYYKYY